MFHKISIVLLASIALATAAVKEEDRIAPKDPLFTVYRRLGTPMLEYPVDGSLILEYEECTIVASNNVVISATYKQAALVEEEPEEPPPPTIDDIRNRAISGDAEAQYLLAYCFQFGQAIEQDYKKAIAWYTQSAMQGYMPAQHNLGYLYMTGKGIERDYVRAYMWAMLAAENGNSTLKRSIEYKLSENEIEEALQRLELMRPKMEK